MKTLKKLGLIVMAMTLALALAACGGDKQPSQTVGGGDDQGANKMLDTSLKLAAEMEVTAGEAEASSLEIAELTADSDNAILAGYNDDIQAKVAEWQQELGEGETLLVRAYVLDTENYLSVVLFKNVAPDYGRDGDVYSYVYDKIVGSAMDVEYAKAWMTVSEDDIANAVSDYMVEGQRWVSCNADAFFVNDDEKPVYLISAKVRQDGADDWTYIYVLKDGAILGNISQLMEEAAQ